MQRNRILIVASGTCFGSFAWALRGHFQHERHLPLGMRLLSTTSLAAFCGYAWQLRQARPPLLATAAGCGLFALSLLLFWWSVASTRSRRPRLAHAAPDTRLVQTSGPYRLVRHPFYLSYILFWLATALTACGLQWLAASILIGWYVLVARHEEHRFAASATAGDYQAYRRRTGMLLPLRKAGRG